jgi:hypothetical protein
MTEKVAKRPGSKWAHSKRRDLTEEQAKKAGYPSNLREEKGWYRGARVK